MYAAEEIETKKREFAAAYLRNPLRPDIAAREVDSRSSFVTYILTNWQLDPEVQNYMNEVRQEAGPKATVPTKEQFAAEIYRQAGEISNYDLKRDYFELFAKVMGYIERPAAVVNNNNLNVDQRSVIMLPARNPNVEDWTSRAQENHKQIVNASN